MADPIAMDPKLATLPQAEAARVGRQNVADTSQKPVVQTVRAVREQKKNAELPKVKTQEAEGQEQDALSEHQKKQLEQGFSDLNNVMTQFSKSIRFDIYDHMSGQLYVQVINDQTDEVIKTIPSEEALKMMERIHEVLGLFVDEQS